MPERTPVDLADAIVAAMQTALPTYAALIKRRYRPRRDRQDFGHDNAGNGLLYITVYMETLHRVERVGRELEKESYAIGVAIQQASPLPQAITAGTEDGDDLDWGDSMVAIVQQVERLWGINDDGSIGPLRRGNLAGFEFVELVELPLFEADHLHEAGVWTSVIMPIYQRASFDEDDF